MKRLKALTIQLLTFLKRIYITQRELICTWSSHNIQDVSVIRSNEITNLSYVNNNVYIVW